VSTVTTSGGLAPPAGGVPTAGPWQPRLEPSETCPLCGTPLHRDQEWCLRCGGAARTRLAATPNWRAPIAAIVAVIVLSLGVLSAALVDLAGSSSPTKIRVTRIVTTAPAAALGAPASTGATPTTTPRTAAPGALVPGLTSPGKGVTPSK
jgi:predicted nucleic acid-binding Zn ribbon protein